MNTRRSLRRAQPRRRSLPAQLTPDHIRSRADLRQLQRIMAHALMRPLDRDDTLDQTWDDGRPTADVVNSFMKPNDRLSAMERLQIYARCYWYRVTASLYEDFPALRVALGERRFSALVRAYVSECPSRSFTLRNLGERLPTFIRTESQLTSPRTELAETIARFEWARTQAFDSAALPAITPDVFSNTPPTRLRLGLQPHLTLLECAWPVDEYVIAVNQTETQRTVASNTATEQDHESPQRHVKLPRRAKTFIVVHRHANRLFYRRETAPSFAILSALAAGHTLSQAISAAGPNLTVDTVRSWFSTWMELHWFCSRPSHSASAR